MTLINALAGIAVSDLEKSVGWYKTLFGRGPDIRPMAELAEWEFDRGGWVQVFEDKSRAGHSSVTLAESDLGSRLADLKAKGIRIGPTTDGDKVSTAIIADPDGNQIVFAQGKDEIHRSTA
jgi:catechol 2,3-dioxygenase-like lactoylglutathione lyase family enzyme